MVQENAYTVTFVTASGARLEEQQPTLLAQYRPGELQPVRKPRAYKGQRHLPGLFWMSRLGRLVSYESRLEMIVLKQLDYDPRLRDVLPQPFTLHFSHNGKRYSHTPDYLAWRTGAPTQVVNVKPRRFVKKDRNQRDFSACKSACTQIGWSYSTQSEPPPEVLANLNWLAGYRRQPPGFATYATEIVGRAVQPTAIAELIHGVGLPALVRPVLFHLLWIRQLECDMHQVLSDSSIIRLAKSKGLDHEV